MRQSMMAVNFVTTAILVIPFMTRGNPGDKSVFENYVLDDIVVTATRKEKRIFDVPYTVNTIGSVDSKLRKMTRSLPEAFR